MLAVLCGVSVGLALGLTGGGGSLFAVPLLVYVLSLDVEIAVPVSLLVVGVTAGVGAAGALRAGVVPLRPVLTFAFAGMLTAPLGLLAGAQFAADARLGAFVLLTLVLAVRMWVSARDEAARAVRAHPHAEGGAPLCRYAPEGALRFTPRCAAALSAGGVGTGLLSGFFGVGGGFLIVPALMYVTQMGVHQAVASSLVVITLIGLSGAAASLPAVSVAGILAAWFFVGALSGMLLGRLAAGRLAGIALQRTFAALLVIVALTTLGKLTEMI